MIRFARDLHLPEQLPPLVGRARTAFLAVWGILFVFYAAAVLFSVPSNLAMPTSPSAMVGLWLLDSDPHLLGPPIGDEATRAGIRSGDRLLAIDNRPVAADRVGIMGQLTGRAGSSVAIDTVSSGGQVARHRLTRSAAHLRQGYASAGLTRELYLAIATGLGFLTCLLVFVGAAALVARRRRDPLAPWASLMMLTLGVGIGPVGIWLEGLSEPWPSTAKWTNLFGSALLVSVLAVFPDGSLRSRWVWLIFGSALAVAVFVLAADVQGAAGGYLLYLLLLAAAVALIGVRYRSSAIAERQQIRWAIFGFAAALLAFAVGTAAQWVTLHADSYPSSRWAGLWMTASFNASLWLLLGGITLSLLRYRLYDADVAISRSVAYGTLTVLLLGVFAGTEKLIEIMGEEYFGESLGALAGGIGAALAAVMIVPLHHRVSHWAEKRFQKQLIKLRHGLPLLLADLRETAGLERIAAAALDAVNRGVRASRATLLVGDELVDARGVPAAEFETWRARWSPPAHQGLDCDRRDALFPMRVPLEADGHGRVGWLLLGPRPDGSFYGRDEREALADIADPLARAVQIVRVRELREAQTSDLFAELAERLRRVEQELAGRSRVS